MESQACPSCGARAGGQAECQGLFDQLGALAWSDPRRAAVHNLVVDVYCLRLVLLTQEVVTNRGRTVVVVNAPPVFQRLVDVLAIPDLIAS